MRASNIEDLHLTRNFRNRAMNRSNLILSLSMFDIHLKFSHFALLLENKIGKIPDGH